MDVAERKQAAKALREAAEALMARGPTNPKAVFRYGSKPNQAPLMKKVRTFLDTYASSGNALMVGDEPRVKELEDLKNEVNQELDDLMDAIRELNR